MKGRPVMVNAWVCPLEFELDTRLVRMELLEQIPRFLRVECRKMAPDGRGRRCVRRVSAPVRVCLREIDSTIRYWWCLVGDVHGYVGGGVCVTTVSRAAAGQGEGDPQESEDLAGAPASEPLHSSR